MSGKGGSFTKEEIAKQLEGLIKGVETSLRMLDASKKSIENNRFFYYHLSLKAFLLTNCIVRQNVHDAEAGAPGTNLEEAKKSLASADDLYVGHRINAQQKINIVLQNYDKAKSILTPEVQARYAKLIENAKNHGLSVV